MSWKNNSFKLRLPFRLAKLDGKEQFTCMNEVIHVALRQHPNEQNCLLHYNINSTAMSLLERAGKSGFLTQRTLHA